MHLREPQSVCAFSFSRRFNFDNMVAAGNLTAAALLAKNVYKKGPVLQSTQQERDRQQSDACYHFACSLSQCFADAIRCVLNTGCI